MEKPYPDPDRQKIRVSVSGFTMLEVLAVLVILSVFTLVALSRYSEVDISDRAAAECLKSHLRYAHLRAMGDTVNWSILINPNSYTLQRDGAPVNLPGENSSTRNTGNVGLGPAGTVYFGWGRGIPVDGAGDPVANDQVINVGSEAITITENTGFIP